MAGADQVHSLQVFAHFEHSLQLWVHFFRRNVHVVLELTHILHLLIAQACRHAAQVLLCVTAAHAHISLGCEHVVQRTWLPQSRVGPYGSCRLLLTDILMSLLMPRHIVIIAANELLFRHGVGLAHVQVILHRLHGCEVYVVLHSHASQSSSCTAAHQLIGSIVTVSKLLEEHLLVGAHAASAVILFRCCCSCR